MANKRMFSKQIIDSDAFLDMPASSQLLYFHLVMRADDEGFVGNPKKIMREVGIQGDDFKILISKRFLIAFESGVVVIKHWLIHNTIRMDRFNTTTYQEEKKLLTTKENRSYSELATTRQPNDNQPLPQVKLSKVNLIKVNVNKDTYGEFKNVLLSKEEYKKLTDLMGERNTSILIEELSTGIESKGYKYKSHYATILNWARRKAQDYKKNNKAERFIAG